MIHSVRILCAFEDRAFEDVVLPVVGRLCEEMDLPRPVIEGPLFTRGCRWRPLRRILSDRGSGPDLVLVGADAGPLTVAQKRSAMLARVEQTTDPSRVVFALPKPCAEGWLQADLRALKQGVEDEIEEPITLPEDTGAYPGDENEAKRRLASILDRADVPMLRRGLEYGPAIMRRVEVSREASLERFDRELRRWLVRWSQRTT